MALDRGCADLARVRKLGPGRFETAVRRELPRWDATRPCLRIVRAVYAAAADPSGVIAHRPGALARAGLAMRDWHDTLDRLATVEARMTAVLDDLGLTGLVTSIAGRTAVGAAAILAENGDPARFTTPRSLARHAGLCPRDNASGGYQGKTAISGRGRPGLRVAAWRAATRAIIATEPGSRVLILTTFDLDEYAFGALRHGASGFILKDVLPSEFVRAVADGDAVIAPSVTRRILDAFAHQLPDPQRAVGACHPELGQLTAREREILTELAGGYSNAEIAQRLSLAEGTVKTHLGRVLTKLGLRDRVQAVVYAYEAGLVDPWSKH